MISDQDFIRYSRQIMLPEFGEPGQLKLAEAKVAIVGVGGLGHHVAHSLAAAGVGSIHLFDGDNVESSNLPRQLLFNQADIGSNKAAVAAKRLARLYPSCQLKAYEQFVGETATEGFDSDIDLMIDCCDNFETRHWVNQVSVDKRLALLSGSVSHFSGQLCLFTPRHFAQSGCYHCLFPQTMQVSNTCSTAGVLGPMVNLVAAAQSLMAIKYLANIEQPIGVLHRIDGLSMRWQQAKLHADPLCPICSFSRQEALCI
ncbi:HesA/MoeB/ThiF family protein [Shewanella waksmanii]|uniref:HesA/MoeB/ThiF family protein n=1 Tax=Shewanella waksmanii TaxID=213783 RepID=UPI003736C86B